MSIEDSHSDSPVVKSLRKREGSEVIRLLEPRRASSSSERIGQNGTLRILLYQDNDIVSEILEKVLIDDRFHSSLGELFQRLSEQEFALNSLPIGVLPLVEAITIAPQPDRYKEEKTSISRLEWRFAKSGSGGSITMIVHSILPAVTVSAATQRIKEQGARTPFRDLVLPGMPVVLVSQVTQNSVADESTLWLYDDEIVSKAEICCRTPHKLGAIAALLYGRKLHVVGTVSSVQDVLKVVAGAVLVLDSQRPSSV